MTEREFNRHILVIRPKLLRFASSFIEKGAATAEDMVQEATLKVWKENLRLEGDGKDEIKNMEALTITILRNVCLDYLKMRKSGKGSQADIKVEEVKILSIQGNPQTDIELRERIDAVRQLMAQLPDEQQMVLRLRDVMGYEFAEIAKILDTSEGNVRTMLSRSRKTIRDNYNANNY